MPNRLKKLEEECDELRTQLAKQQREMAALRAVVSQLPKCWRVVDGKLAQDVPVVPGMDAWLTEPDVHCVMVTTIDDRDNCETHFHGFRHSLVGAICLFDSREAAEKARGK